jgi:putative Holliday junction resolvase
VTDSAGTLALPRTTVLRSGDPEADHRRLVDLVLEEGAVAVVVGHPLSLDGRARRAAADATEEAGALRTLLAPHGIEVVLFDERLTTVSAHQALSAGGADSRRRREVVDQAAAAVLLEAWLAAGRPPS